MSTDALNAVCPHCEAVNRIPAARRDESPQCGRCGEPLFPGRPVALSTAAWERFATRNDLPVLVDFWATWCGPCKTLTPTLEKVVRAAQGRVRLVKIDIDKNRELVQQLAQMGLPLQSVPTVVGFVKGQIADLFQGALPEGEVKKFIETLLKAGGGSLPGADLLAEAKAAAEAGDHQGALNLFAGLLEAEPENAEAFAGLARSLMALGEEDQARLVLDEEVPEKMKPSGRYSAGRSPIVSIK
jgi:putative thioredoxin